METHSFERLLATFSSACADPSPGSETYGLIAFSVGQRRKEIGIRMALGAKASDISRMILGSGLKVAAIGPAVGFVLALPPPKPFDSSDLCPRATRHTDRFVSVIAEPVAKHEVRSQETEARMNSAPDRAFGRQGKPTCSLNAR